MEAGTYTRRELRLGRSLSTKFIGGPFKKGGGRGVLDRKNRTSWLEEVQAFKLSLEAILPFSDNAEPQLVVLRSAGQNGEKEHQIRRDNGAYKAPLVQQESLEAFSNRAWVQLWSIGSPITAIGVPFTKDFGHWTPPPPKCRVAGRVHPVFL